MLRSLSAQLKQEEGTASLCNQTHNRSKCPHSGVEFPGVLSGFPRCSHVGRPADPPTHPLSRGCWCRIGPQRRLRLWTQQDMWGLSLLFSETRRDRPVISASLNRDTNRARWVQDSGAGKEQGHRDSEPLCCLGTDPVLSVCLSVM